MPEWSLLYKMFFDQSFLDDYTKELKDLNEPDNLDMMNQEDIAQLAKFQVEYYFGQTNYNKDFYLKSCEGKDGWIPLEVIYGFFGIRKFHHNLTVEELYETMKASAIVEVKEDFPWRDSEIVYYIRKAALSNNQKTGQFFGYEVGKIKKLGEEKFESFLKYKLEFEEKVIEKMPIVVTTVSKACTKSISER